MLILEKLLFSTKTDLYPRLFEAMAHVPDPAKKSRIMAFLLLPTINLNASSTAYKLFGKGKVKIANKLGEEAVETITAYLYEGKEE